MKNHEITIEITGITVISKSPSLFKKWRIQVHCKYVSIAGVVLMDSYDYQQLLSN